MGAGPLDLEHFRLHRQGVTSYCRDFESCVHFDHHDLYAHLLESVYPPPDRLERLHPGRLEVPEIGGVVDVVVRVQLIEADLQLSAVDHGATLARRTHLPFLGEFPAPSVRGLPHSSRARKWSSTQASVVAPVHSVCGATPPSARRIKSLASTGGAPWPNTWWCRPAMSSPDPISWRGRKRAPTGWPPEPPTGCCAVPGWGAARYSWWLGWGGGFPAPVWFSARRWAPPSSSRPLTPTRSAGPSNWGQPAASIPPTCSQRS